jgi:hypothetical protein
MKTKEQEVDREMRYIRNYGILVLAAFFVLNISALFTLNWFEVNDLQHELVTLSEKLPEQGSIQTDESILLPEDIFSFRSLSKEHTGFYKTNIIDKEYLAYANPEKDYILMKSEESINTERQNFAIALSALFGGEVLLILGWWFFIRTRVRQLFDIQ